MSTASWRDGIQRVNDEAAGMLAVEIISPDTALDLLREAMSGSHASYVLFTAVTQAAQRVQSAPRKKPVLCVCCPRPIRRLSTDILFGVAVPATPSATSALGFAICGRCAEDRRAALEKAQAGLSRIWPGLRPVTVTHHGPEAMQ